MAKLVLDAKSLKRALPESGQIELWDPLTPGFGLRLSSGGARTFFVMRRVNGKLVRRTVGRACLGDGPTAPGEYRLAEAREQARQMLSDLKRGIDPKFTIQEVEKAAAVSSTTIETPRQPGAEAPSKQQKIRELLDLGQQIADPNAAHLAWMKAFAEATDRGLTGMEAIAEADRAEQRVKAALENKSGEAPSVT